MKQSNRYCLLGKWLELKKFDVLLIKDMKKLKEQRYSLEAMEVNIHFVILRLVARISKYLYEFKEQISASLL